MRIHHVLTHIRRGGSKVSIKRWHTAKKDTTQKYSLSTSTLPPPPPPPPCICIFLYFIFRDTTANTQMKQLTRITKNKNFRYGNTKYQTAPKDYPKETVFRSRGSPK